MALTGVLRPGYVQLRVLDLDEAIRHYRDRVGLNLVSVEGGRAFFQAFDEFDRHSVILREADSAGLDRIGFKVARDVDLDHFAGRLRELGVLLGRQEPHPPLLVGLAQRRGDVLGAHRLGDRQLSLALHMVTRTQVRMRRSAGRGYYDTKISAGRTHNEAMRCLNAGSPTTSGGR